MNTVLKGLDKIEKFNPKICQKLPIAKYAVRSLWNTKHLMR